jgi:hypothetical protein
MMEVSAGWGLVILFSICIGGLMVATMDREDD